jgi:hypothetical protein
METYKILEFRQPRSLYDKYNISERKPTLLILGFPSLMFTDRTMSLWNTIAPKLKLEYFSPKVSCIKNQIKKSLLVSQYKEPLQEWTVEDFNLASLSISNS